MQLFNDTSKNPTSPPYLVKNERSLKQCDVHKEWYIKAWLHQWELIQSSLIKHLKEIH